MAGPEAPTAVDLYLRDYLERQDWRATAASYEQLAKLIGVSKTQVVNLKTGSRGAGTDTEAGFARLLFDGSVDALRKEAERWAREKFGERLVEPDRYPSRGDAIKRLAGLLPAEVIEELRSQQHKQAEGWATEDWIWEALILKTRWERRQEGLPDERAAEEADAHLHTDAAVRRGKPTLPKAKGTAPRRSRNR